MTAEQAARRQEKVKRIVEHLVAAQALPTKVDSFGVSQIMLPLDVKNSQEIPWVVAFDKAVAQERAAEFVSYVNPRFQQIRQAIGDGPVWCLNKVRPLEKSELEQGSLLQSRFGFYIQYSTHGETREELWTTTIGTLPESLISDAFDPKAKIPSKVKLDYEAARLGLRKHIDSRLVLFRKIAAEKMQEDREGLSKYQPSFYGAAGKAERESEDFYQGMVDRLLRGLSEKYEITVRPRLVSIEAFVLEDVE